MKVSVPNLFRSAACFALVVLASGLSAQPAGADRDGARPRRQPPEARWLMTPVEGANLSYQTFDSAAAGEKVSYLLYLPPGYEKSGDKRYPVVYWLHGIGGSQQGMPRLAERLTQAIAAGKAPPMIVVFANGMVDSFYCDALNAHRPVETVIIKELIPHIDATWRTLATREGRMIEGFSMGGFGAARLGFKYPELFGSISIIDGALLGLDTIKQRHRVQFDRIFAGSDEKFLAESPFTLAEANAARVAGRTAVRLEVGMITGPNAAFHELLEKLKVAHDYEVHVGAGHNLQVIYDRLGDRNWEFYRKAFTSAPEAAAPVATAARPAENPERRGPGVAAGTRPRDQAPSWLMPPVEGPNLHYMTFESQAAGQKVSYLLYLPPGYDEKGVKRYPVVFWLHGIGGSQQGVPLMTANLTKAINAGKAPPMIFVFVNGMIRSSYVDSADGKTPVETVAIKELIPHLDATCRTLGTREGRMIEGFSMGGAGAAKWGFKFPDLFGSISIVDGALENTDVTKGRFAETFKTVYGGDMARFTASNPWDLAPKNAEKMKGRTVIRIITRTAGLAGANEKFHDLLTQLGLEHEFYKIPDAPHSPNPLYEGLGERNWPFYFKAFPMMRPAAAAR